MNQWRQRKFGRFGTVRQKRVVYNLLIVFAGLFLLFSVIHLINYYGQKDKDEKNTTDMLAIIESVEPQNAIATTNPIPETPTPSIMPTTIPASLELIRYNDTTISEQTANTERIEEIKALKERYEDIVGWITIDGVVNEAVVQRDNVFYLNHDASGNSNINGALFLDAIVDLSTRPYSMIIYGHNMRSGAKFGDLYKYENEEFFSSHSEIEFDTIYETGKYEVFAAGVFKISDFDIFFLNTLDVKDRMEMIKKIRNIAAIDSRKEVSPADQLLFLVTCVDDDSERRFVVARRIE